MRRIKEYYSLPLHIMFRPFDGFYQLRYEGKGRLSVAIINVLLVWFSISFMNQYTSITATVTHPHAHNSLRDGIVVICVLLLWCVSNWAVTSLTNGEGRFKDIFLANCYAMTPIILFFVPASILSNFLTDTEAAFFFMIVSIAIFWFVMLAYAGMVTIHNYSAGRALLTVFLTIIAMLIIVFLLTLLAVLLQQMIGFAIGIYTEITFRR